MYQIISALSEHKVDKGYSKTCLFKRGTQTWTRFSGLIPISELISFVNSSVNRSAFLISIGKGRVG